MPRGEANLSAMLATESIVVLRVMNKRNEFEWCWRTHRRQLGRRLGVRSEVSDLHDPIVALDHPQVIGTQFIDG